MTWAEEMDEITAAATDRGVDALFIAAIRRAENGSPGGVFGEFGVPTKTAPTYRRQAEVCASTVRGLLIRFDGNPFDPVPVSTEGGARRAVYRQEFIAAVARQYAPIGADNDPEGLNRHWESNVSKFYRELVDA